MKPKLVLTGRKYIWFSGLYPDGLIVFTWKNPPEIAGYGFAVNDRLYEYRVQYQTEAQK